MPRLQGPALVKAPAPLVAGRVSVELDPSAAPKACENFRCLCTGEKGKCKSSGKALHYRGVPFHRIVTGFVCQGGDIVRGDGSGKSSIYGKAFADEKGGLAKNHESLGVLGMANSGKNSNTSQFYFTLGAAPACNGKHVVLGKVVQGEEVLKRIGEERARVWMHCCGCREIQCFYSLSFMAQTERQRVLLGSPGWPCGWKTVECVRDALLLLKKFLAPPLPRPLMAWGNASITYMRINLRGNEQEA